MGFAVYKCRLVTAWEFLELFGVDLTKHSRYVTEIDGASRFWEVSIFGANNLFAKNDWPLHFIFKIISQSVLHGHGSILI